MTPRVVAITTLQVGKGWWTFQIQFTDNLSPVIHHRSWPRQVQAVAEATILHFYFRAAGVSCTLDGEF